MTTPPTAPTTSDLLGAVRAARAVTSAAEVDEVVTVREWALAHEASVPDDAATLFSGRCDTGLPIAGEGAPLVSEFALIECVLRSAVRSIRAGLGSARSSRSPSASRDCGPV